jgi:PST family polysaccharide transporter
MVSTRTDYFRDNVRSEDHSSRSLRGGVMSVFARGITAVIQTGCFLIMARLLSPEDYGLVAMVMAFTGFAPLLTDLGTQDVITQAAQINKREVSAFFWITVAVGAGFALVAAAASPLIARFYGEPRLTAVGLVSSLTFVACSLTVLHSALMRRALMFWELGIIEVAANVLSAVGAIAVAYYGYGYWALVFRPTATPLLIAAGVWTKCGWLPGRPLMTPRVRNGFRLGLNITGYSLVDFASKSGDRIAIGSRMSAAILGQYQNALMVYDNVGNTLVAPLHSVAVASLSKMRDDLSELRAAWAKALSTVAFYSMAAFGLLATMSQDVMVPLLGSKWSNAGLLLSILALRGIPHSVERTAGWLHVTAGRTDRLMRYGIFAACVQITALLCGMRFGPVGIALASVMSMFLLFIPAVAYGGRPLGIRARDVVSVVWRQLVGSLLSAALVWALRLTAQPNTHPALTATLLATVYVVSYLAIVSGLLGLRVPVRAAKALIGRSIPLRFANLPVQP